ncbi:MAG: hypothetical protein HYW50_04705 [Candidatus Diapherotrites archaeon]|nr:hypothetical protein [Candidatus Diapherotrites archaeon]
MGKGQASVELLVVLATGLIVLIAVFSYTNQSVAEINNEKLVETARSSVNTLKDAANDVYSQGVGAKKQVFFVVPQGTSPASSGIIGQSIVLNLLGSDVFAKTNTALNGQIPTTPGGHWVWVTAFENYVAVGTQNISIDKTSSYVTLLQNDSKQDTITITNNSTENATVTITKNWSHTNVTLDATPLSFTLNSGAQQTINLTYASNPAAGNYAGTLDISATFPTIPTENISLPLNAEVTVTQSRIIILPITYSVSLQAGGTNSSNFQVCNNSTTTLTSISFTKTGAISTWISPEPIPPIASLNAGQCQTVPYTISVPPAQPTGTYNGEITATDGTNSDSIAISVTVVPTPPFLSNVDVLLFSDSAYTIPKTDFNQSSTVYYEVRTFDQDGSPLDVSDLNITVTDPASTLMQRLEFLSTIEGKYQGSYSLSLTAPTGAWTVTADANKNNTVSDSNNFTTVYYPFLTDVRVLLFSNSSYTTPSTSFQQGNTVYYEIQTFDQFISPLDVVDLNVRVTDPSSILRQELVGLSTTGGKYQGSYALALNAETGSWTVSSDANKNNTVSDFNNFTVTPAAECATQAICFSHAWNSAAFTCVSGGPTGGRYCQLSQSAPFWSVQNTAATTTLTVQRIMVSWTGDTDGDTTVDNIVIDNVQRNTASTGTGVWNNITDFSMTPGQTFSANNWLRWGGSGNSGKMNNETETYTISFEFTDASVFSTAAYNPP